MNRNDPNTKLCKHCQTEIPRQAKVCPNCRRSQGNGTVWVISTIIALIVTLAVSGGEDNSKNQTITSNEKQESQQTKKKQNKKSSKKNSIKYIKISATDLIDIYKENQVKCKQAYDGKNMKVTGTVSSVGTDVLDEVYVCLGSDTSFTIVGIQCYAKDKNTENKIAELKEGDIITVSGKGKCGSLSFTIQDAEIIK